MSKIASVVAKAKQEFGERPKEPEKKEDLKPALVQTKSKQDKRTEVLSDDQMN